MPDDDGLSPPERDGPTSNRDLRPDAKVSIAAATSSLNDATSLSVLSRPVCRPSRLLMRSRISAILSGSSSSRVSLMAGPSSDCARRREVRKRDDGVGDDVCCDDDDDVIEDTMGSFSLL